VPPLPSRASDAPLDAPRVRSIPKAANIASFSSTSIEVCRDSTKYCVDSAVTSATCSSDASRRSIFARAKERVA
jgi:hypothetical protein